LSGAACSCAGPRGAQSAADPPAAATAPLLPQVREGERGAEVRLTWQLSRQVRLQAALRSLRMSPSVLLQYSSEGS
jgi:hypothetical protein